MAFMQHVTLYSQVAECGVFYAVHVISITQYVAKGSRQIVLRNSCIF
jgi:hypothetical protein